MFETNDVEWDKILNGLYEDEAVRKEVQDKLLEVLIHGGRDYLAYNINMHPNALDSRRMGVGVFEREVPTELPTKICNYRKPKVYWFGEADTTYSMREGARHWAVEEGMMMHYQLEDHFRGKRFIGISEPPMEEQIDSDFLKKFTGDEWVETRTLNKSSHTWKPQGEIFIMSGKPLKINNRDKDIIDKVTAITYPSTEQAPER